MRAGGAPSQAQLCPLEVIVKTGDVRGAGTDADVSIVLTGSEGGWCAACLCFPGSIHTYAGVGPCRALFNAGRLWKRQPQHPPAARKRIPSQPRPPLALQAAAGRSCWQRARMPSSAAPLTPSCCSCRRWARCSSLRSAALPRARWVQAAAAWAGCLKRPCMPVKVAVREPSWPAWVPLGAPSELFSCRQGWFLEWVKVMDRSNGAETLFTARAWLDEAHGLAARLQPGGWGGHVWAGAVRCTGWACHACAETASLGQQFVVLLL